MKIIHNFIYHDFVKYYIFILIFHHLILSIQSGKCDNCIYIKEYNECKDISTDGVGSPSCNCSFTKPHNGEINCYLCPENVNFYNIYNNGTCEDKSTVGCSYKIIAETGECVGHCPSDTLELGDFCYNQTIENSIELNIDTPFKTGKCINYYWISKVEGEKIKYICMNTCNTTYYNNDTKECLSTESCGINKIHFDTPEKIRCTSKCNSNEYLYKKNNTCLDKCDIEVGKFYYERLDGSFECVDQCDDGDIYNNSECLTKCGDNESIIYDEMEINNKLEIVKQCKNEDEIEEYFEYNEIYFKNCSLTKILFDKTTYANESDNICIEDCSQGLFRNETHCVEECPSFYYKKICLDYCEENKNYTMNFSIINNNSDINNLEEISITSDNIIDKVIKIYHFPSENECLDDCPIGAYKDEEYQKCYITSCYNNKFITSDLKCKDNCEKSYIVTENEIIKVIENKEDEETGQEAEEGEGTRRNLEESSTRSEIKYYNLTKRYCLSSCPKSSPYHNFNENECFNTNCKERKKYYTLDNPYVCYDSCSSIRKDYNYEKDYVCYNIEVTCDNYFYKNSKNETQCASLSECISKQFKYLKGKECTNECESNYYKIEFILNNDGEIQGIGACVEDVKYCINEKYIFYNHTEKICRKECDLYKTSLTNPMKNKDNDTCFSESKCPVNYPYLDRKNKLCLMNCDNNQFNDGIECLETCENSTTNKTFRLDGTNECIEKTCKKDNNIYFKDEYNKTCYQHSCPETLPFVEIVKNETTGEIEKICKNKCGDENPYYYEDNKTCLQKCDNFYISTNASEHVCVDKCSPGQKVVNNTNCTDICPPEENFILKEKLEGKSIYIEKCVSSCNEIYPYVSNSSNYCLKNCTYPEMYSYNNTCYEYCPKDTYADEIERICYNDSCHGDFNYYVKDERGFYKCVKNCPFGTFYKEKEEGGECSDKCPDGYNYTARTYICLKNCSNYGGFFKKNETGENFICQSSCGDKILNPDTNECVSECPPEYFQSPNGKCYQKCINDSDYPFSYDNGTKKVCAKKCEGKNLYYDRDEKMCLSNCSTVEGKSIIDYDNACVSKCSHSYYQYLEDGKCVNQCNETKFINSDKECVDNCSEPYNYIENRECKIKCESNSFSQEILKEDGNGTNIFECVEKCDKDRYYYETGPSNWKNKCFTKCQDNSHLIIQDTQKCIALCESPYKMYFSDKTPNSTYKENTCVLKCPTDESDKTFEFLDKCVYECSGIYKFHVEGEKECRNVCPSGTYYDKFVCKKYCPEEKFLDHTEKNCLDSCEEDGNYKYYTEGINKCLKDCESGYFKDGFKCVKTCSGNKTYIDGNQCVDKCPDHKSFVNPYDKNNCLDKCPDDFPYYENKNKTKICKINCDYIFPDGECLSSCNETYNFYNYENGSCLSSCPSFYAPINEDGNIYKCYNKCPSQYPYFSGTNCTKDCKYYINLTTNECHEDCDINKYFIYEENSEGNKKYCLDKCSDMGVYQLGKNKCVKDCSSTDNNYTVNMEKKTCECEHFYYINDNNEVKCISDKDSTYNKRLYGTNQYLKNCRGYILSLDEEYCYPLDFEYQQKTTMIENNTDNQLQFKCLYKYYKNNVTSSIECLNKDESCPPDYQYLIPEKQECVKECDTNYIESGKYCLNKSICEDKKIMIYNDTSYKCDNECPNDYYSIKQLNQCVKNCTETDYYIFHNKECILSCDSIPNTIMTKRTRKSTDNSIETFYECACTSDIWYKDDQGIHCNSDSSITTCESLNNGKTYLIKDTRECVNECPNDYKYKFNKECYHSCDDVANYYNYNVKTKNDNECQCENLWIKGENDIINCIEGNICNDQTKKLVVYETKECVQSCSGIFEFNKTCYNSCPSYTNSNSDDKTCTCKNKWYSNSIGIITCLGENEDCPRESYPYLINDSNECVSSTDKCISPNNLIFNNTCYKECPINTKIKEGENTCECDQAYKWNKYTKNGKDIFVCGLEECPGDKNFIINETQECKYSCENLYNYNNICYPKCPENTQLVNEISKICDYYINFDNPENLEDLEEKVEKSITKIYPKASKGGIIYNINNSTLQIYGVNKNKKEDPSLIMRTNLTYIDLSNCIDKIYEKKGLSANTDLIIEKYDIGDLTDSSTINPVEYKVRNANTGEEINLKDICDDNSIIISYPLGSILNSFTTESNKLRNLEDENQSDLNLREKFLKGKELFLANEEIDSFNFENKIYTDICSPLDIDGKDLILEDRFNYLYPFYSFCESNCLYSRTDFVLERVYCNCSPKDSVNLERTVQLLRIDEDINKVKDNQKGSVLKCLGTISEISKNFGFFYGLIILLVEIAMVLLTFLYSYKVFSMRLKKKFDIEDKNNADNFESVNLSKENKNTKKTNEENIKTSERNLENPPKRKKKKKADKNEDKKEDKKKLETKNNDEEDPEVINIKKTKNFEKGEKISSTNSDYLYYEKSSVGTVEQSEDDDSIFDSVKSEVKLLRVDYETALAKNKAEILVMILAEILDKIYIVKAIWFLQKYEIFALYFSLYLLWHMLIVSFLSLFYNNSTLHKIWIEDNYPTLNFHLGFGFISCILSFIIYKGLSFLINNDRKIAEIESISKENNNEVNSKFEKMMFWAKIKMIIFYVVTFILIFIFYLYLISFCGVYSKTSGLLVESYGISLIEVIIIKILYGLVLGILRKISLSQKINKLYLVIRILDLYVS